MNEAIDASLFRRSSFCGPGSCVEVAVLPHGSIALRDGKHPHLPAHIFTTGEWTAFLAGVKNGEFDTPVPA